MSSLNLDPNKDDKEAQKKTIRFRCSLKNCIVDVLNARGWTKTDSETDWDFNWGDIPWMRDKFDSFVLEPHQRVNHFRNQYELTRKDLLIKNLKRMKRQLSREGKTLEAEALDFFPSTYVLPSEYAMFNEEYKRNPSDVWIMKPVGKAQGKGIFLFKHISEISDWRRSVNWNSRDEDPSSKPDMYIVQRYVPNPYLIGGRKFDLRIYVLVTSYSPLTVYLYRSGFARFSNSRFTMDSDDISNNFVHLTNVAIQKTATTDDGAKVKICKWSLHRLRIYLSTVHGQDAASQCFSDMQALILRSLLSVQPIMIQDRHCFELYGYDILLDTNLKPWLIEVNASPSLSASDKEDYDLKFGLLSDVMNVLDLEGNFRELEPRVGGFELIYSKGKEPGQHVRLSGYSSLLGCVNNREDKLRNLKRDLSRNTAMPRLTQGSGSGSNAREGRRGQSRQGARRKNSDL